MNFKVGESVSLKHYMLKNPLLSLVSEVENDFITIKLVKEVAYLSLFEGDAVVIGCSSGKKIYSASCIVFEINVREGAIKLKIDNVELIIDQRFNERFNVSLYADINPIDSAASYIATVENISLSGMMICTKAEFEVGQVLEIDLFVERKDIKINADIIWGRKEEKVYIYGLKTDYTDSNTKIIMEQYIQKIKEDNDEFIKLLRNL